MDRLCYNPSCRRSSDIVIVCLILTPLAILWWAGTWQMMDIVISTKHSYVSHLISLAIGLNICISGSYASVFIAKQEAYYGRALACRVFNYVYSLGLINFWRGVWGTTDDIVNTQEDHKIVLSSLLLAVSVMLLILLRGLVSCVSFPFWINTEFGHTFKPAKLRFRSNVSAILSSKVSATLPSDKYDILVKYYIHCKCSLRHCVIGTCITHNV